MQCSVQNKPLNCLCLMCKGNALAGVDGYYHLGAKFSSYDQDNDDESRQCGNEFGAFWHGRCYRANLNGPYYQKGEQPSSWKGVVWVDWKGDYSLKFTEMKIRPF